MLMRLSGIKITQSKGRVYCYHRASGTRLKALPSIFNGQWVATPELLAEVAALEALPSTPKAGTVHALIVSYRSSLTFTDLSDTSKKYYRRVLNWICDRSGMESPARLTPSRAREVRDIATKNHGYRFGKYVVQVMRVCWQHGIDYGHVRENPWRAISLPKRPKNLPEANRPWTAKEFHAVISTAPLGLARALALCLMGFRPSEVPSITWAMLTPEGIAKVSSKTQFNAVQPIPAALASYFEGERFGASIASNHHGKPWTYFSLASASRGHLQALHKAGKIGAGCTLKGLNHTLGTALAEQGVDPRAARDAMQKKSMAMAEHYSRRADTRRHAREALSELSDWLGIGSDLANFDEKLGQPPENEPINTELNAS